MYNHYLYRHIRLDKNVPFYIGVGSKYKKFTTIRSEYKRAYDHVGDRRNKIWKDIVAKTSYKVEILIESNNYKLIKQKEVEFVKLYGRIDKGTGTLANLTDGGEGSLGIICSKEKAMKISIGNTGKIKSQKERDDISRRFQKSIIEKETGKTFPSIKDVAKAKGISLSALYVSLWPCSPSCKYKYADDSLNFPKKVSLGRGNSGVSVKNIETGEVFKTCKEAAEFEGMNQFAFYSSLNHKKKYFKYIRLKI